jgi:pimeloyl-ACP methyl ester carboxylesterase
LFPGLGADDRLLEPQKVAFPNLEVPPWIAPRPHESLASYAHRMAPNISDNRPFVLGGVSLGGMLAWELAALLRPEALLLIASCHSPKAIARGLRWSSWLMGLIPSLVIEGTKPLAPAAASYFSHTERFFMPWLVEMYRDTPSAFLRWGVRAACTWKPSRLDGVPVYHIHGANDRLILARRSGADELVPGAGHLLNLTHVDEVNAFIATVLEKASALEVPV